MILAIDTATRAVSLALRDDQVLIAEETWQSPNHHTIELSPRIDAMLKRAEIKPAELSAIGVSLGPGSFTGLRIGLSVAKGMALAHPSIKLIGVPTLDIIAAGQGVSDGIETLCTAVQAGRGRVSAGFYHNEGGTWKPSSEAFIASWPDLINRLNGLTLVAGEIDPVGYEALSAQPDRARIASPAASLRRAGYLAEIAYTRLQAGQVDDPSALAPIYLH